MNSSVPKGEQICFFLANDLNWGTFTAAESPVSKVCPITIDPPLTPGPFFALIVSIIQKKF